MTTYIERDKYIEEWIIDLNVERGIINSSTFIHQFPPLESPSINLKAQSFKTWSFPSSEPWLLQEDFFFFFLKQSSVNVIDNYNQTHWRQSINEQSKLTTIIKHIVGNPLINNWNNDVRRQPEAFCGYLYWDFGAVERCWMTTRGSLWYLHWDFGAVKSLIFPTYFFPGA